MLDCPCFIFKCNINFTKCNKYEPYVNFINFRLQMIKFIRHIYNIFAARLTKFANKE